ncbi:MAG: thioesterase family protein [Victivallales bacterium]|nr:thioesterase family protein [Victivallales bacterium]
MARVKLTLPETWLFRTAMPLRITDINYGGHLGNDAVLGLVHEARVRFYRALGGSEMDLGGAATIMTDAIVVFRAQGLYGMTLEIKIAVADFTATGCDLYYQLHDLDSGREIARVKTGIAFFDYQRGRPVPIPAAFRGKVASMPAL